MTTIEPTLRLPAWTLKEQPAMPGSPAILDAPLSRRLAYVATAVLCGVTASLGNAIVSVNIATIGGDLALTQVEGQWLVAAFLMTSISANFVMIKVRQQFGIRLFAIISLSAYAVVALLHLTIDSYASALLVRAAAGMASAALNTMAVLYMLQVFGAVGIAYGIIIGISLTQLGVPLASVLAPSLIDLGEPHAFYQLEAGLALLALAGILVVRLPKALRVKVFAWRDLCFYLTVPVALALVVAVLEQGRMQWWTDKPWMGLALAIAIPLLAVGLLIEHGRSDPVFNMRVATSAVILRLVFGALMLRLLLSEQSVAAVGLLRQLGAGPDQLQMLYVIILCSFLGGAALALLWFKPGTMPAIIVVTAALIAAAALIDSNASSDTRPHDMYVSQGLIGVASGLFVGPLLISNIMAMLKTGYQNLITVIVLFAAAQSLGAAGSAALLSTYQVMREHEYSGLITADVDPTNPVVQQRLQVQAGIYEGFITDPALRTAEGDNQLAQTATREANVRAYLDVIQLIAIGSVLFLLILLPEAIRQIRNPPEAPTPKKAGTPPNMIGAG